MGYLVLLIIVIALTFGLIAVGAIIGFAMALYVFRPQLLVELIPSDQGSNVATLRLALGLAIAGLTPVVGGLAYALSGGKWLVDMFGPVGQWLWAWVAGAYVFGFIVGCLHRRSPSHS